MEQLKSPMRGADLLLGSLRLPSHSISQALADLSEAECQAAMFDWRGLWARPNQLAPDGDWLVWLILAGRGFGKTRSGAEWIREEVEVKHKRRLALVGQTAADVRDTMIEGESGILAISRPDFMPIYQASKRRVVWPNGAVAFCYSAEKPRQLRGPQHESAWLDELASWKYTEAFDQLLFGLRLGTQPQVVITTTPRPIPIIKELLKSPNTVMTGGSTYENLTNLAPTFLKTVVAKYASTRLGEQELMARILDDVPGALWKRDQIDALRVTVTPSLARIVVGVDPAVTSGESSDDTGIVVVGRGTDGHGYVLDDMTCHDTPHAWATQAITAYHKHHADCIVVEVNQGGDLVRDLIRQLDPNVNVVMVRASRGKITRAEPVAGLYEQGRIHHVGMFGPLEDQMCNYAQGNASPDNLDALVWAATDLFLHESDPRVWSYEDTDTTDESTFSYYDN